MQQRWYYPRHSEIDAKVPYINALMQKTSIFTSMDLFQKPLGWLQDTAESLNHGIAATTGTGNKEGKPGRSFWNGETKSWEVAQYRD
jgi:hypothetical protein